MTDEPEEERRFLESARRALGPTPQDAERVLATVNRALALAGTGAAVAAESREQVGSLLRRLWQGTLPRLLVAASLTGGAGALGYSAGFRAGAQSAPSAAKTPPAPPSALKLSEATAPASAHEMQPDTPLPANGSAVQPRALAPLAHAPQSPSPAAKGSAEPDPLSEEVRTLRRVERALREHNPRLALALLGDLDRSVPSGQLAEERLAATTQARCALGYGSASALLRDFSKLHPRSPYLARVTKACTSEPAEASSGKP